MNEISPKIQGILDTLPMKPGCYIMHDSQGTIIYVGKAVNLRNRVRSYFHNDPAHTPKTRQLVRHIADIEFIVVGSELEALILEMNLIKKYRPRYNIQLKDDKLYPYIKICYQDPFPKISITRRVIQDGSRYYGPYTSVWAVRQTLDLLRKIFPYLTCDREITGQDQRACLFHDIHLCSGPCIGAVTQKEYYAAMENLGEFLEGKTSDVIRKLEAEMKEASEQMRYERAAIIRDQLEAISRVVERQKIVGNNRMNSDVIALAHSEDQSCVQIFFIRDGKMIGQEYFILDGTNDEKDQEILSQFIKQYYSASEHIPPELMLPEDIEESKIIQQWLSQKRGGEKVQIKVPKSGNSVELVNMATENAIETLRALKKQWDSDTNKQSTALQELQTALHLKNPPNRIECYDISNTQGTNSVGSMVVFEQGVPNKAHYRRFNIKTVIGPNDFDSMTEVLTRRIKRWESYQDAAQNIGKKPDPSFSVLPDLIIMDGGKGQLGRAVQVLEENHLFDRVAVTGLAKREEELFLPHLSDPVILDRHSQALYLVQRVRDEAHRFAITAHRHRRTKEGLASQLEKIPGIGPIKRKALLERFGSIQAIAEAEKPELMQVKGISEPLAETIRNYFGGTAGTIE